MARLVARYTVHEVGCESCRVYEGCSCEPRLIVVDVRFAEGRTLLESLRRARVAGMREAVRVAGR